MTYSYCTPYQIFFSFTFIEKFYMSDLLIKFKFSTKKIHAHSKKLKFLN